MDILIIILAAVAGGVAGKKLRLPVGAMTGALIAVVFVKLILEKGSLPSQIKIFLQILSGMMIGSRVKWEDIKALRELWFPAIILIFGMIGLNLWSAGLMYTLGKINFVTAYFASAPGGLQDMALIAEDFEADTFAVSICQVCRVLYIMSVLPFLYRIIHAKSLYPKRIRNADTAGAEFAGTEKTTPFLNRPARKTSYGNGGHFLVTLIAAAAGGMLFRYLGIAAGALLGALFFTAILNIGTGKAYFPVEFKMVLQMLTGGYVGMQVSRETICSVGEVLEPMMVMLLASTLFIYLLACLIYRLSKLDFMSCLMICTPGGLQEMCLLADDMECDVPKIVVMQTIRIVIVVSFCPVILQILQSFLR